MDFNGSMYNSILDSTNPDSSHRMPVPNKDDEFDVENFLLHIADDEPVSNHE